MDGASFAFSATTGSSEDTSFCSLLLVGDFGAESAVFLDASFFFASLAFVLALLLLELDALLLRDDDEEPEVLLPDELEEELEELEE